MICYGLSATVHGTGELPARLLMCAMIGAVRRYQERVMRKLALMNRVKTILRDTARVFMVIPVLRPWQTGNPVGYPAPADNGWRLSSEDGNINATAPRRRECDDSLERSP